MLGRGAKAAALLLCAITFNTVCPLTEWAHGQELLGFHRDDYGKVTLSRRQVGAGPVAAGNYKSEPVSRYGAHSLIRELGKPIGRLDIRTDVGTFPCTAFLISDTLILTNHHCVPGVIEDPRTRAKTIDAISLLLGYVSEGIAAGTRRFDVIMPPIETDKDLDYSILKVSGSEIGLFGQVKLAVVEPRDNDPYMIIGHPVGSAQHVSREGCASAAPAVAEQRLRHECDTLPGNSGSPVLDHVSNRALAIHHAGSSLHGINYAVPFSIIIQHSAVLREQLFSNRARDRVSVYWHEGGLTEEGATRLEKYLTSLGVGVSVWRHNDQAPPDAIYFRPDAEVDIVRIVLGALPYKPRFVFPVDYDNYETGARSNYTMSVGLSSRFRYDRHNPTREEPYALSEAAIAYLIEDGISQEEFVRRLTHIAPPRLATGNTSPEQGSRR